MVLTNFLDNHIVLKFDHESLGLIQTLVQIHTKKAISSMINLFLK